MWIIHISGFKKFRECVASDVCLVSLKVVLLLLGAHVQLVAAWCC